MRLVAVVLAGCGRVGFARVAGDTGIAGDSSVAPTTDACVLTAWSVAQPIAAVNTPSDDYSPTLATDDLTLWVLSNNSGLGGYDIFETTRSGPTQTFGAPSALTVLNSTADEDSPTVSADGLVMYFSSLRSGAMRLYTSVRGSAGATWGTPAMVPSLATEEVWGAFLSTDGTELFYNHRNPKIELAHATVSGGVFALQGRVAEIDDVLTDPGWPSLSSDGLTLYFEARPATGASVGVYTATRPSRTSPFGAPTPLAIGKPTDSYDGNPDISRDNLALVFSATPSGAGTSPDVYIATRACE